MSTEGEGKVNKTLTSSFNMQIEGESVMYNILCDNECIEKCETLDEANNYIAREVLDACREDVLCGCYSKTQEQNYWNRFEICYED